MSFRAFFQLSLLFIHSRVEGFLPPSTPSNSPYTTLGKRVLVQHFTTSTGERSEFDQLFCLLSTFTPIALHLWKGISAHPAHPTLLHHWGLGLCSTSTPPLSLHQREGGKEEGGGRKMMRKFGVTFFFSWSRVHMKLPDRSGL